MSDLNATPGPPPIPDYPAGPPRRTGSLVTPLILIGLGALFLARNLMPDLPLLDYLANYWPLILIGWGLLRAVEIVSWSVSGRVLPRFGISGGEWLLVILLCIGGLSLHAARGFYTGWLPGSGFRIGGAELFGEAFEYPVTANAPAPANPRIVIEGVLGHVRIAGTGAAAGEAEEAAGASQAGTSQAGGNQAGANQGGQIVVTGHHIVRAMNQRDADRAGENAELEISTSGNEITVRANHTQGRQRVTGDLLLQVPRGASIVSRSRETSFDIHDIDGTVDLTSRNASVRLEAIGGDVRLDLSNADLIRAVRLRGNLSFEGSGEDIDIEDVAGRVSGKGSFSGVTQLRRLSQPLNWDGLQTDITAQAVPGDMRLTISDLEGHGLIGPVRIESTTKDVWLTAFTGDLDMTLVRGDVMLAPAAEMPGRLSVRVNAGDLELALPEGMTPNLSATTNRGDVSNRYGSPIQAEEDGRRGATLRSFGDGDSMTLSVGRGDITVSRAGAESLDDFRNFDSPDREEDREGTSPGVVLRPGPYPYRWNQGRRDAWQVGVPSAEREIRQAAELTQRELQKATAIARQEMQQAAQELHQQFAESAASVRESMRGTLVEPGR